MGVGTRSPVYTHGRMAACRSVHEIMFVEVEFHVEFIVRGTPVLPQAKRAEAQGDIDNIVKPVLDALCRHTYNDNRH